MNLNDSHPNSTFPLLSEIRPFTAAQDGNQDDDLSDSDLSQFQAEIEQNLSSASPGRSLPNGTNEHGSDEVMEVDSEDDVKPTHVNKVRRRMSTKEYYDPELFGLRRSVSRCSLHTCILSSLTDPGRHVREQNQIDLSSMYFLLWLF
jgi:hypothetical protein